MMIEMRYALANHHLSEMDCFLELGMTMTEMIAMM